MNLFMTILINVLIFSFAVLILFQLHKVKEGLDAGVPASGTTYQPYDPNNPTILAQQNAGNIQVLKGQMDELIGIKKEVEDISGNLYTLTEQVNEYMLQQATSAQSQLPSIPPAISPSDLQYT